MTGVPADSLKIAIVAGEASGDLLGAKLIHLLREYCPKLQVIGMGGPAMIAAGCDSAFDMERLSVMGLIEPLLRLPDLIRLRRDLYHFIVDAKPDVFIGIDSPDFNLGLELKLHKAGIPTVHYVSPSVWAWRKNRIHKIAKAVDLMLTLFPFEAKFYETHHIPVQYVGHPLAEQIPLQPDTLAARHALGIDEKFEYVALLPGSRRQEIHHLAKPMLLAAKKIFAERPTLKFLTSHVNEERHAAFFACYQQYAPELPLQFFMRRSHEVMAAVDAVVVTSGTATLETMLYKKPMVIVYRMPAFTYWLAKRLVKIPYVGLPNLLSQQQIVPELIQDAVTPEAISKHLLDYFNHPEKVEALVAQYTALHQALRVDSASEVVEAIIRVMQKT